MWASRFHARSPAAVGLLIRFLFIGSRLCSTLLSDPASRRSPCASLSLLLHQDGKRTFTSQLLNMLGTHEKGEHSCSPARLLQTVLFYFPDTFAIVELKVMAVLLLLKSISLRAGTPPASFCTTT